MSDHGQFHKVAKHCLLTSVLGSNAQVCTKLIDRFIKFNLSFHHLSYILGSKKQKRHRRHRDTMIENISNGLHTLINNDPGRAVSLRELFVAQIFSLALKQVN